MDLRYLKRDRQGGHGTHKLLSNPAQPSSSAVLLQHCRERVLGSMRAHWDGDSASQLMTA